MPFARKNKHAAKLTKADAYSIRQRWAERESVAVTQLDLAKEYCVSINTIRNVLSGATFQEVPSVESPSDAAFRVQESQSRLAALLANPEAINPEVLQELAEAEPELSAVDKLTAGGQSMIDQFLARKRAEAPASGAGGEPDSEREEKRDDET